MIPFAREIAAICEADAQEIEDAGPAEDAWSLRAMFERGSDPHPMVAAAIVEIETLAQQPKDEAVRLRELARQLRRYAEQNERYDMVDPKRLIGNTTCPHLVRREACPTCSNTNGLATMTEADYKFCDTLPVEGKAAFLKWKLTAKDGDAFCWDPEMNAKAAEMRATRRSLSVIRSELGDCKRCGLCQQRTNIVFGDGPEDAQVAFVGEGPGADEDREGKPFVGQAGQLLNKMLDAMAVEAFKQKRSAGGSEMECTLAGLGFKRSRVRILNTVMCRPPGNRKPDPEEISACLPFLERQLQALPNLKCIVTLGATPAFALIGQGKPDIWRTFSKDGRKVPALGDLRGRWFDWRGIPLMPTWHPAYLLRDASHKPECCEDLKLVIERMK